MARLGLLLSRFFRHFIFSRSQIDDSLVVEGVGNVIS